MIILESQRVASVVHEHEELHSPNNSNTDECPICLETIHIANSDSMTFLPYCGDGLCESCNKANTCQGDGRMTSCPLCLACPWPESEECNRLIEQHAERGRSWAQCQVATWYLNGSNGWPIDKREALKWFEGAAEKRFSPALCDLSIMHRNGLDGIVTQSDSRAMSLMKE